MNIVDLRGKPCPIPVIEAKKILAEAAVGAGVRLLVDNDIARQNLQKLAHGLGHGFQHEKTPDGAILVTLTRNMATPAAIAGEGAGLVVAIGSAGMGRGDDELGGMLMKSFLFSLTELETPPKSVLFFNGGVRLTCEGSAALADLSTLEAKGVAILSCGACLDYYQLTDSLRVGAIGNMYSILDTMSRAGRLIHL